jgi:hypothetical protein
MLRATRANHATALLGRPRHRSPQSPQSLISRRGHIVPHRKGQKTKNKHHDKKRRMARLSLQAREALCLVMLAAFTGALIRSQVVTPGTAMAPACEMLARSHPVGAARPETATAAQPQARLTRA